MLALPESVYWGRKIHEFTLKLALQRLVPDIHFDLGANLNIWHPKINRWQGIYHHGRHIGAMGRDFLPEFNQYREEMISDGINDGEKGCGELLRIGWRTTIKHVSKEVPGITEAMICADLGVDEKRFTGTAIEWIREFSIPDQRVDPILNTLG